MRSAVSMRNLVKRFQSTNGTNADFTAVDDVSLEVGENEFLAMVGPSGCGKSTLLRMIAGLEDLTGGELYMHGKRLDLVPLQRRNIGFMFQGYALFKHMTVAANIEFGLILKKMPGKLRRERVCELVSLMGLEGLEGRKPAKLSGGQQQRVALARALAPKPELLLLDEPFGAVDAKVRQRLRADTKRWQRELRIPTILVTHDQREALELGDRVAVMNEGRFEQVDVPRRVYDNPSSEFVARFVGRVNVFDTVVGDNGNGNGTAGAASFKVMVRPEDIDVWAWDNGRPPGDDKVVGTIVSNVFLGRTVRLEVQIKDQKRITVALPKSEALDQDLDPGKRVALSFDPSQVFAFH